jgi:hypothetical protein
MNWTKKSLSTTSSLLLKREVVFSRNATDLSAALTPMAALPLKQRVEHKLAMPHPKNTGLPIY